MDFDEIERLKSVRESLRNGDYTKTVSYEESGIGKLDVRLRKIDDDISKYHSDQNAQQEADARQQALDRKKDFQNGLVIGIISGTIGSTVAGLIVYYWPAIISFVRSAFH